MGMQTMSRGVLKYTGEPEPAPADSFRYLGLRDLDGRPCDVVGRRMFFFAGQASDDYLIYGLDTVTHLPRVAMHFAADGRQLEYYHYKNINLDTGLIDKDFDFSRLGK